MLFNPYDFPIWGKLWLVWRTDLGKTVKDEMFGLVGDVSLKQFWLQMVQTIDTWEMSMFKHILNILFLKRVISNFRNIYLGNILNNFKSWETWDVTLKLKSHVNIEVWLILYPRDAIDSMCLVHLMTDLGFRWITCHWFWTWLLWTKIDLLFRFGGIELVNCSFDQADTVTVFWLKDRPNVLTVWKKEEKDWWT